MDVVEIGGRRLGPPPRKLDEVDALIAGAG
jgi:hypothetical protein